MALGESSKTLVASKAAVADSPAMPKFHERIRLAREQAGLTQDALGDAVGVTGSAVSQWEKGIVTPDTKRIAAIARKTGTRAEWLTYESGPMVTSLDAPQPPASPAVDDLLPNVGFVKDAPPMFTSRRDLPVLGFGKAGSLGFFVDNGNHAGIEYRPENLHGVSGAYAIEVRGHSMEPRLEPGWLLFIHPRKPARTGQDVVVQLVDGQALIKTYVRSDDNYLILRQYSPAKDIKIPVSDVESVDLVVGIKP